MRALVTGATGFIGSALVETLRRRGDEVTCLVRSTSDLRWISSLGVSVLSADLAEPATYAHSLAGFDYVYHLAGLTKSVRRDDYFLTNGHVTRVFAQTVAGRCRSLKRFVLLSSLAATGPSPDGNPVTEDTVPHPVSWYGESKLEGENAVMALAGEMPLTVIRPPGVYGPRDGDFFVIFRSAARGIVPYVAGGVYSLLYVADLAEGIAHAAVHPAAERQVFFLADPHAYTNADIIDAVSAAVGRTPLRIPVPRAAMPAVAYLAQKIDKKGIINVDRVKDFRYTSWTCSAEKAERMLGFRAGRFLREGMQWTADWYRTHKWL